MRAVAHDAGLELDHLALAAVVGRDELLAPREHEPDRALGGAGQRRDVGLEVELALAAEPAAEVRDDDADVALGQLEGRRDAASGR